MGIKLHHVSKIGHRPQCVNHFSAIYTPHSIIYSLRNNLLLRCWSYILAVCPLDFEFLLFMGYMISKKLIGMVTSSNGKIFHVTDPLCGKSPVTGEFPAQRPATRSFDVFFDLWLNKRLNKQSWGWWFETPSRLLWRHCNELRGLSNMEG